MMRIRTAIVVAVILFTAACDSGGSDNGNTQPPPEEIEGRMIADVSGKSFEANLSVLAQVLDETLVVTGADSSGQTLRLVVHDVSGTGVYAIGGIQSEEATAFFLSAGDEYLPIVDEPGSINLTRLDSVAARGTFEFSASSLEGIRIDVEGGEFLAPRVD